MPHGIPTAVQQYKAEIVSLQRKIDCIQQQCSHRFKHVSKHPKPLEQSLVRGVYLAGDLPAYSPLATAESSTGFAIICRKCELRHNVAANQICFRCLHKMEYRPNRYRAPEKFGIQRGMMNAAVYGCTKCRFSVVAFYWDT